MASTAITRATRATLSRVSDYVAFAAVGLILLLPPPPFSESIWWLRPLVVMAVGWSFLRRKSAWGPFFIAVGLVLFVRAYRQEKLHEEIVTHLLGKDWSAS